MRFFAVTFLVILTLSFIPGFVFAQRADCPSEDYLIPCGGPTCPCTFCDFFAMIQRVINFVLIKVVPAIVGLMMVAAGAMMISAYVGQSGPETMGRAKKILIAMLIGLFIVYFVWVLFNVILSSIDIAEWTGLRTWWVIRCDSLGNEPPLLHCGNGNLDMGEVCDCGADGVCTPEELGNRTCQDLDYAGGELGCLSSCRGFDFSGCEEGPASPECGNGTVDIGEVCDCGADGVCSSEELGDRTCQDFDYPGGELGCFSDCLDFDFSGCEEEFVSPECGNETVERGEVCDCGADGVCTPEELGNRTCQDFSYAEGDLGCLSSCLTFDFSGCERETSSPECEFVVVRVENPDAQGEYYLTGNIACEKKGYGVGSCVVVERAIVGNHSGDWDTFGRPCDYLFPDTRNARPIMEVTCRVCE